MIDKMLKIFEADLKETIDRANHDPFGNNNGYKDYLKLLLVMTDWANDYHPELIPAIEYLYVEEKFPEYHPYSKMYFWTPFSFYDKHYQLETSILENLEKRLDKNLSCLLKSTIVAILRTYNSLTQGRKPDGISRLAD